MAYYNCLLLDVDNTLLDFDAAEHKALLEMLQQFGLPTDDETQQTYVRINNEMWESLNRGKIRREKLFTERFSRFLREIGREGNPAEMNKYYLNQLGTHADVLPGAIDFLRECAEVATLVAVSNGAEKVQLNRLKISGIGEFFDDVLISEHLGVEKPNAKIFQMALRKLGIENAEKVLVVGDSLSADIQGGVNAGLDTCWVNFAKAENHAGVQPKYEIRTYEELYPIIMEQDELQNVGSKNRKHLTDAL